MNTREAYGAAAAVISPMGSGAESRTIMPPSQSCLRRPEVVTSQRAELEAIVLALKWAIEKLGGVNQLCGRTHQLKGPPIMSTPSVPLIPKHLQTFLVLHYCYCPLRAASDVVCWLPGALESPGEILESSHSLCTQLPAASCIFIVAHPATINPLL